MKDIVDKIYEHPIITAILITTICSGASSVISAVRGVPIQRYHIYLGNSYKGSI